ncbi:MAG: hypothetical protein IPG89_18560 [Bacteroidetes bacterium]|nr:hypothetical protein [Bacteroidota bacterium]
METIYIESILKRNYIIAFSIQLLEQYNLERKSYFIEQGICDISELYNAEIILSLGSPFENFKEYFILKNRLLRKVRPEINLYKYDLFLDLLSTNTITKMFTLKYSENNLNNLVLDGFLSKIEIL